MKRKDRIILLILFVLFFAIFLLLPIIRRQVLIANEKSKTKVLEKQIEEQKKIKEGLEKEIKDSGNSENIEKIARDQLNMSNDKERVYKFVDDDKGDKNGTSKWNLRKSKKRDSRYKYKAYI